MTSAGIVVFFSTWWWAFGVVAAFVSFFANYTKVVEWWDKKAKGKQPKLSISLKATTRTYTEKGHDLFGKSSAYDRMYEGLLEFNNEPIVLEREYNFIWSFNLIITNISEFSAYGLDLNIKGFKRDKGSYHNVEPKFPINPFVADACQEYELHIHWNHKCSVEKAKSILDTNVIDFIVLKYRNNEGKWFDTEFDASELYPSKRNKYTRLPEVITVKKIGNATWYE